MSDAPHNTHERETAEKVAELSRRRGFFFPSSEPYGGVAGFYTFGPTGAALKENLERAWRDRFAVQEDNLEVHAPSVMPEAVFAASGHLDTFDDMLIECGECNASHRADHLVEEFANVEEAEGLPREEVASLVDEYAITCPDCGADMAGRAIEDFNLMFETTIGPGEGQTGYLRPETAQGIFVDFPRLKEYARNQLPFGVTQIGPAYRNEISPRGGLLRLRELTQAELELFVDPDRDEPPIERVATVELPLLSGDRQRNGATEPASSTVAEAIDSGLVSEPWIGYYLGITRQWYDQVGLDIDRFRFRQHLAGERAHYASDCWDAEADVTAAGEESDWIELAGIAYRGEYDLSKHAAKAEEDYTVFRQYDEPVSVERPTVDPDMSVLGPKFGDQASEIVTALEELAERDPDAFSADTVRVAVDGEDVTVPVSATGFAFTEETKHGEHVRPHVVEPSFGVDRLVYALVAHGYREDVVDGEARTYLALDPTVAPTFVGVFPLLDALAERARALADRLRQYGLAVAYDDAGSIGRRYRRQDEVGTPYCVTLDERTQSDDTVTVRERDSTEQIRVGTDDLPTTLAALRAGDRTFAELRE